MSGPWGLWRGRRRPWRGSSPHLPLSPPLPPFTPPCVLASCCVASGAIPGPPRRKRPGPRVTPRLSRYAIRRGGNLKSGMNGKRLRRERLLNQGHGSTRRHMDEATDRCVPMYRRDYVSATSNVSGLRNAVTRCKAFRIRSSSRQRGQIFALTDGLRLIVRKVRYDVPLRDRTWCTRPS